MNLFRLCMKGVFYLWIFFYILLHMIAPNIWNLGGVALILSISTLFGICTYFHKVSVR